jgi:hypothetical protein
MLQEGEKFHLLIFDGGVDKQSDGSLKYFNKKIIRNEGIFCRCRKKKSAVERIFFFEI